MPLSKQRQPQEHALLFDPVPFHGGSKIASFEIIRQSLQSGMTFTVLTCDPQSWKAAWPDQTLPFRLVTLHRPGKLIQATSGWRFWLKHLYFMLMIGLCLLRLSVVKRHRPTTLIGISGPGVDMALYGWQTLGRYRLLQFVHGPVPRSRSVGYCLTRASRVYYLDSSQPSLHQALRHHFNHWLPDNSGDVLAQFLIDGDNYRSFTNGIGRCNWPTPTRYTTDNLLWAASLLKWKGLDTLVNALRLIPHDNALHCDICFIRPHNIRLPQSQAPVRIPATSWYEQPDNLDQIRANCSLFVSTSEQEPFGLSILEALAAGLCVVIPQDGSFWDKKLRHNVNCIKYTPGCAIALAQTLQYLKTDRASVRRIGQAGQVLAQNYRAETCYQAIVNDLSSPLSAPSPLATGRHYA